MNSVQVREFFRSEDGQVFSVEGFGREVLYSPNGEKFFELYRRGFGGSNEEFDLSFEDPHHERNGRFHRSGDTIELDGTIFRKIDEPRAVDVVPLPEVRKPEYLFRLADGNYLYVSADKYRYSYESFRMWIGSGEEMREVIVKRVGRYRDGGTTQIDTEEGVFFNPIGFAFRDRKSTWKDEEMTRLDLNDFVIVENDRRVTVRPRL